LLASDASGQVIVNVHLSKARIHRWRANSCRR